MTPTRLADCWVPVFDVAKAGFVDPSQSYATLSSSLISLLDAATARSRTYLYDEAEIREAMFAVVAWIDETAMSYPWAGAAQWRLALLQSRYFSTSRAGLEFFQRLDALPEAAQGAREVFGLVLLAGFQGRYATRPAGELMLYRQQCLERIALDNRMAPLDALTPLFMQPANLAPKRVQMVRRGLPRMALIMLIALPLLILAAMYVSFDLSLGQQVTQLLEAR